MRMSSVTKGGEDEERILNMGVGLSEATNWSFDGEVGVVKEEKDVVPTRTPLVCFLQEALCS